MRPKSSLSLLLLLVCLLGSACSKQGTSQSAAQAASAAAPEPPTVKTAAAAERVIERAISVTGTLQPDESVTVSSEVVGRIARINYDFGQSVKKGDVLVVLDATEFSLQVERSRSALNQALARLGLPPYNGHLTPPEDTPSVRQARAQLEDAKFKYESASRLIKTGDIARDRFNELENTYRARQAALEAARDEVKTQWANVAAMEADMKIAEKRRNDTIIRAPFDGVIGEKLISAGQFVKDNIGILRIVKVYPMRLRVEVPESAANLVRIGTELSFTTDAAPGQTFQAVVREMNPTLETRNRSLSVEARMSRPDERLRPGMFVQVKLISEKASKIVTVPKQAVYSVAGLTKAFRIDGGVARQVVFAPGLELDGHVEVPGGVLRPGEKVAITELGALSEGTKVRQ